MKKFYEAPVVELNAFSVEDVITTSTKEIILDGTGLGAAVVEQYGVAASNVNAIDYNGGNYTW